MLAVFESNVFAALRHHTCRTGATADDGSNRSAFAATRDDANDRADTGSRADFGRVIFRGVASFDTTFSIDLRIVVAADWSYLDQLRVQRCSAIVGGSNLVKRQLQLSNTFDFARSLDRRDSSLDDITGVLCRFKNFSLDSIAALARVS